GVPATPAGRRGGDAQGGDVPAGAGLGRGGRPGGGRRAGARAGQPRFRLQGHRPAARRVAEPARTSRRVTPLAAAARATYKDKSCQTGLNTEWADASYAQREETVTEEREAAAAKPRHREGDQDPVEEGGGDLDERHAGRPAQA